MNLYSNIKKLIIHRLYAISNKLRFIETLSNHLFIDSSYSLFFYFVPQLTGFYRYSKVINIVFTELSYTYCKKRVLREKMSFKKLILYLPL